jgi:hypothetical protein
MWDLNFGTWISHRGFIGAFGHGHPLVIKIMLKQQDDAITPKIQFFSPTFLSCSISPICILENYKGVNKGKSFYIV